MDFRTGKIHRQADTQGAGIEQSATGDPIQEMSDAFADFDTLPEPACGLGAG